MTRRSSRAYIVALVVALVVATCLLWLADRPAEGSPRSSSRAARPALPVAAARDYWRHEFRRRWLVERRDGRLRANTIRALRATLRSTTSGVPLWPWTAVANCESGQRWSLDALHDGGIQFHPGTWAAYRPAGYPLHAYEATPFQQVVVGELVLAAQGWRRAWPDCSRKLGLR